MPQGKAVIGQSGGPTAVINRSLVGFIKEATKSDFEEILGAKHGLEGMLNEDFVDLASLSEAQLYGIGKTPAAALGSVRKKPTESDIEKLVSIFEKQNIRNFYYIGGNDSAETANLVAEGASSIGYEMKAFHIPKTIDNDLLETDHCPGYGSVVKYICSVVRESAMDHEAMGQHDLVSIIEVMGRNAGWIAAGSTLAKAKDNANDAPHLILLPEVPFSKDKFVEDVQAVLKKNKYCLVVVGEGLIDKDGNYIANSASGQDAFGHQQLGGVGDFLASVVEQNLAVKARSSKLGIGQRAAAHCSSQTDNDEAFMAGKAAVKAAVSGETDKMVILVRAEGENYQCETSLAPLSEIANGVKEIPEDWISEDGISMNAKFIKYCQPLIQGEVQVPFENGVPSYVRLSKRRIRKVLDPHEFE